ncbi:MAG: prephenate dehydrogenase [Candidatus Dactylopiibacterium carminicum]|uniref:prephenate dehydrogenase n=1 Tax=Candidatus Dactylopiibacterium carminicum TaxID=857335 RepID=A0A272EPS0_9RHOO|nr:prephenate dehydrogenase/arogenate dehydrogenase family protein [Candidatus Dactylopiibacterium carminicum]KAF7598095.1 prephenate dehydrogenase/arogenate dehydrogenase family protein [Candidatus Dactylopiibacterium carminicum]PAS91690.1 MAG: prephenate dehydrogenase [Candidatus Dactylopiibacterium carminicum]PAS96581.1 MAG: prephenate dehydrogenase [Candidatus Dactylopiibacterium carminicum]
MSMFARIVICGVGLIGGSFALALKKAGLVQTVVGVGRSAATLEEARSLGLIDEIATDWAVALKGADLLLLAMPVGQMDSVMKAAAPHLEPQTLVTDAGSTKGDVFAAVYENLQHRLATVVPAHPIAGAEKSGPTAAFADLYQGKRVVLTPLPESDPAAVARVRAAWEACGARISEMHPQDHDRVFAAVSHLPHLLAFGLVHEIQARDNAEQLFGFAASGFRDFTRIAGSHPEMWRDICMSNRQALLAELDTYLSELAWLRALLIQGDAAALERLFTQASQARNAWGANQ